MKYRPKRKQPKPGRPKSMTQRLDWLASHAPSAEMHAFVRAYQVALRLGASFGVEERKTVLDLVKAEDWQAAQALLAGILERAAGITPTLPAWLRPSASSVDGPASGL